MLITAWVITGGILAAAAWRMVRSWRVVELCFHSVEWALMAAGMLFWLWMAQHWLWVAEAWQDAYWRDTESLRKQLQQLESRQSRSNFANGGADVASIRLPVVVSQDNRRKIPKGSVILKRNFELHAEQHNGSVILGETGQGCFLVRLRLLPGSEYQRLLIGSQTDSNRSSLKLPYRSWPNTEPRRPKEFHLMEIGTNEYIHVREVLEGESLPR